ncbi:MAG: hypothetical protein IKQ29_01355 [Bacilli bacterium]|nr:hypothetical protein [Bacilli bacterium]
MKILLYKSGIGIQKIRLNFTVQSLDGLSTISTSVPNSYKGGRILKTFYELVKDKFGNEVEQAVDRLTWVDDKYSTEVTKYNTALDKINSTIRLTNYLLTSLTNYRDKFIKILDYMDTYTEVVSSYFSPETMAAALNNLVNEYGLSGEFVIVEDAEGEREVRYKFKNDKGDFELLTLGELTNCFVTYHLDVVYTESQEGTSETDGAILAERNDFHEELRQNGYYDKATVENAVAYVKSTLSDVHPELKSVDVKEKDAAKKVLEIIGGKDIADVYDPNNPGSAISALSRVENKVLKVAYTLTDDGVIHFDHSQGYDLDDMMFVSSGAAIRDFNDVNSYRPSAMIAEAYENYTTTGASVMAGAMTSLTLSSMFNDGYGMMSDTSGTYPTLDYYSGMGSYSGEMISYDVDPFTYMFGQQGGRDTGSYMDTDATPFDYFSRDLSGDGGNTGSGFYSYDVDPLSNAISDPGSGARTPIDDLITFDDVVDSYIGRGGSTSTSTLGTISGSSGNDITISGVNGIVSGGNNAIDFDISKDYDALALEQYNSTSSEIKAAGVLAVVSEANNLFDNSPVELSTKLLGMGYSDSEVAMIMQDRDLTVQAFTQNAKNEELAKVSNELAEKDGVEDHVSKYGKRNSINKLKNGGEDEEEVQAKEKLDDSIDSYKDAVDDANSALEKANVLKGELDELTEKYGEDYTKWTDEQYKEYSELAEKYNDAVADARAKVDAVESAKTNYQDAQSDYDDLFRDEDPLLKAVSKSVDAGTKDLPEDSNDSVQVSSVDDNNKADVSLGIEAENHETVIENKIVNDDKPNIAQSSSGSKLKNLKFSDFKTEFITIGAALALKAGNRIINGGKKKVVLNYDELAIYKYEKIDKNIRDNFDNNIIKDTSDLFNNNKDELVNRLKKFGYSDIDASKISVNLELAKEAMLDGGRRSQLAQIAKDLAKEDGIDNYESTYSLNRSISDLNNGTTAALRADLSGDEMYDEFREQYFSMERKFADFANNANRDLELLNESKDKFNKFIEEHGNDSGKWSNEEYKDYETLNTANVNAQQVFDESNKKFEDIQNVFNEMRLDYIKEKSKRLKARNIDPTNIKQLMQEPVSDGV